MKITQVLCKHHIGWYFKKHWHVQGRKKPIGSKIVKNLENRGITVYQPEDILNEERTFQKVEVIGYKEKPVAFDETHPDWHEEHVLQFKDNNVLVEGLKQAKLLTRTVELQKGLPESFKLNDISKETERFARQIVRYSQMFDAEQKKLPKIKDPERYFFNFPRVYGITQNRRSYLTISKILQLIENTSDQQLVNDRYIFSDLLFSFPFNLNEQQLQLQLSSDIFLSSSKPLKAITNEPTVNIALPDLKPLEPTVSLTKEHIYKLENIYPINTSVKKKHPHTLFVFYNPEEVKNEFEEPVTDSQILGRSLLKTFTAAASYARQTYGNNVKTLPEPVTVQCVQTDGRMFHFGILQLNTLDLAEDTIKNIWFQTPLQYLFENCSYQVAKPTLEGFNSDVLKHLYAFYNNV